MHRALIIKFTNKKNIEVAIRKDWSKNSDVKPEPSITPRTTINIGRILNGDFKGKPSKIPIVLNAIGPNIQGSGRVMKENVQPPNTPNKSDLITPSK